MVTANITVLWKSNGRIASIHFGCAAGYYAFGNAAGNPNKTYVLQLLTNHRGAVATALVMVVLNVCVMSNLL